ncbi:MAG: hypothetical protein ACYTKD_06700 [Planctomycetota bacterium]|jgi:hypothetical protein
MSPSDAPEPPGARFPFAAAALCAACVVMATWLWIRHSYAWDVTPGELLAEGGGWPRRLQYDVTSYYVRLRGVPSKGPWPDHGSEVVFVSFHDGPAREWPPLDVVFRDTEDERSNKTIRETERFEVQIKTLSKDGKIKVLPRA